MKKTALLLCVLLVGVFLLSGCGGGLREVGRVYSDEDYDEGCYYNVYYDIIAECDFSDKLIISVERFTRRNKDDKGYSEIIGTSLFLLYKRVFKGDVIRFSVGVREHFEGGTKLTKIIISDPTTDYEKIIKL